MRLTRKEAIALCIALWTWCMETGKPKIEWPKWPEIEKKYDDIRDYCFFCEYVKRQRELLGGGDACFCCPLEVRCYRNSPYQKWDDAETPEDRKKYAGLFLEQIRTLEKK